jgi:hypothetical protein
VLISRRCLGCRDVRSTIRVTTGRGEPGTLRQPWHGLLTPRRAPARRATMIRPPGGLR